MAILDQGSRTALFDYLLASFDDDNAADMEAFARNFLHNGKIWDLLAEHFPTASPSSVKAVMLEAFTAWSKRRSAEE